jgi:hypothetical protein
MTVTVIPGSERRWSGGSGDLPGTRPYFGSAGCMSWRAASVMLPVSDG